MNAILLKFNYIIIKIFLSTCSLGNLGIVKNAPGCLISGGIDYVWAEQDGWSSRGPTRVKMDGRPAAR